MSETETREPLVLSPLEDEPAIENLPEPIPLTPEQLAAQAEADERDRQRQREWALVVQALNDNSLAVIRAMRRFRNEAEREQVVTLVANQDACCIKPCTNPEDCPDGDCLVITDICDDTVDLIGGNPGAPAVPAGYLNPGTPTISGDRPYAGMLPIFGIFGAAATADYYGFEYSKSSEFPPIPYRRGTPCRRRRWAASAASSGVTRCRPARLAGIR